MVTSVESASTKVDYRISDGTKSIRAYRWAAEGDSAQADNKVKAEIQWYV